MTESLNGGAGSSVDFCQLSSDGGSTRYRTFRINNIGEISICDTATGVSIETNTWYTAYVLFDLDTKSIDVTIKNRSTGDILASGTGVTTFA